MNTNKNHKKLFGLIGKNISYSFSKSYFQKKFESLNIADTHTYVNFDLANIKDFSSISNKLTGCNVTIPYKEKIISYLSSLDSEAEKIGAVNTVKIQNKKCIGYNTDCYGFENSINPYLTSHHKKALILGTGGASKAIKYVLSKLGIMYTYVSRTSDLEKLTYEQLSVDILKEYNIIINCSPIGTFPNIYEIPKIPYSAINHEYILYDLVYNPAETMFLKKGKQRGATTINGLKMLELQAEKSWEIWNQ